MKMQKIIGRGRLAWLLSLVLVGVQLSMGIDIHRASADPLYPAPNGTGYFVYVLDRYGQGTNAYNAGNDFPVIQGSTPIIILDFGRQWQNPTTGNWGISLIHSQIKHSLNWVISVSQAFIDGYNHNQSHPATRIAIGVNNGNYPWDCDNTHPESVDGNWYIAGQQWGGMINNIVSRSRVQVWSANDIEDWSEDPIFQGWGACGLGTRLWLTGFMYMTTKYNYNFGNNPRTIRPLQWPLYDVWAVSWGYYPAFVLPEIYCTGSGWAQSWVSIISYHGMRFDGVASDNARSFFCGPRTLTWQEAWGGVHGLNTVLTNNGFSNAVLSTAISPHDP